MLETRWSGTQSVIAGAHLETQGFHGSPTGPLATVLALHQRLIDSLCHCQ